MSSVAQTAAPGAGSAVQRAFGKYRDRRNHWIVPVLLGILAVLIIYPLGILVYASFVEAPPRPGAFWSPLTLDNYAQVAAGLNLTAIRNSLVIAVCSTVFAVSVGSALAWLGTRTNVPGKALVNLAGVMPLFVSSLVGALAYALIASPRSGYVNLLLRDLGFEWRINIFSIEGVIFVLGIYYAPYAYLLMASAFSLMNPELEEAAEVHGGNRFLVFRTVTLPLAKPAFLGALILTIVLTIENFPVPMILGSQSSIATVPTLLFWYMMSSPPRPNLAASLGVALLVLMFFLVWLQARILKGREYYTVGGKGLKGKTMDLGAWRWPAFAFAALYFFLAVLLPMFALLQSALRQHVFIASFAALFDVSAFGLSHFRDVLSSSFFQLAFTNSLIVATAAAIGGGLLAFVLAYTVNRTNEPGRHSLEYIAMMPVAMPALVVGMGFLWAWLTLPVPIYGTLAILVMAYIARFMPQGYRAVAATVRQVHPDLEESATVAGAPRWRAVRDVTLPLMFPGLVAASLLLFVLAIREVSTTLFLFTTHTRVMSIIIYEQWEAGRWPLVATMSLIYTTVLLIVTIVAGRWLGGQSAARSE